MAQKKKPVHQIRFGCVCASIWANVDQQENVWFNIMIERRFRGCHKWKETNSFRDSDLPHVVIVAGLANDWIRKQHDRRTRRCGSRSKVRRWIDGVSRKQRLTFLRRLRRE